MSKQFNVNLSFSTKEEKDNFMQKAHINGFQTMKKFVVEAANFYEEFSTNNVVSHLLKSAVELKKAKEKLIQQGKTESQIFLGINLMLQVLPRLDDVLKNPLAYENWNQKSGFIVDREDLPFLDNELL